MNDFWVMVVLLGVCLGTFTITTIIERRVSEPEVVRGAMMTISVILGVLILSFTDSDLWENVAVGLFFFAAIYVLAPIKAAMGQPGLHRSIKLPEREELSAEEQENAEKLAEKQREEKREADWNKEKALDEPFKELGKEAAWQNKATGRK